MGGVGGSPLSSSGGRAARLYTPTLSEDGGAEGRGLVTPELLTGGGGWGEGWGGRGGVTPLARLAARQVPRGL